ncbi:MAG: decarboxylating 6-phosphogluconate dehydrogenase, partial [Deltaproteobacteria bacterium]|nr:decarboxylating 6-phosphogluconate dehydrogenase [Deltaproteobacteria bacterium]
MELGMIGLGRMGANMTERLVRGGHKVITYDQSAEAIQRVVDKGALGAHSLADFVKQLSLPRAIWLMVPSGDPVDQTIDQLLPSLVKGDVIIDGGNSNYKDSIRRAERLNTHGLHFIDAGTSGGIWGLQNGYCMMVGGDKEVVGRLEPIFLTLAPKDGYLHAGPNGAGHFVKMIHNGIEYGMMQAYGEGFELLHASQFNLDLEKVAHLWNQGSVVRSWLLELCESAFEKDAKLDSIKGYVEDSGEGRWTVIEAIERGVSATVLTH